MQNQPLTIGISTSNRRALLETFARSLAQVERLDQARLLVMDDCSQEFDGAFLQQLFPGAQVIRAPSHSGGDDFSTHRLFEHFARHGSGHLLNLNVHLPAARNLVERCLEVIACGRSPGQPCLYSLISTHRHDAIATNEPLVVKSVAAAAGTLWEHGLLSDLLDNVPVSRSFHLHWNAYLARRGIPIRVVEMDRAQAFDGYEGYNLAAFFDHTREALLQMLAEQKARLDRQNEALLQLSQVIQSQGTLLNDLISEVCAARTH